mgnify:CR=1 FL=1
MLDNWCLVIPPVWGLLVVFFIVHHEGFAPLTLLGPPLLEERTLMPCVMAMAHHTPYIFSLGVCQGSFYTGWSWQCG